MEKSFHRLYGMRCYLSGAMDKTIDHGVQWREDLSVFLKKLGVIVLDPCKKPLNIANEMENRSLREELKEKNNYKQLAENFKIIRTVDLRMVDMADFLVVKLDTNIHTCGTYEELSWANRMKRPILIWCVQEEGGSQIGCGAWFR